MGPDSPSPSPTRSLEGTARPQEQPHPPPPQPSRDSGLILIVEDDVSSANALHSILTRKGCDAIVATTLKAGLEALARKPRHIILDLMLPDGDGAEILRRVKATNDSTRVVVTTALADMNRLRAVQELQPHRLLTKPLDLVDLLDAIGMM